uniref:Gastrula zinc finger n=1 Tax=Triatoma infestans TaxID=30076 RepID=A0A161M3F5_TRIIF
MRTKFNREFI